jgi:hypothetical protein
VTDRSYDELRRPVEVSPNDPGNVETRRADNATEISECDVFLTVQDVSRRYGLGKTRTYQLIHEPWFPTPVIDGPYRWSLASLRAAERARAQGTSRPVPAPRPRRRRAA